MKTTKGTKKEKQAKAAAALDQAREQAAANKRASERAEKEQHERERRDDLAEIVTRLGEMGHYDTRVVRTFMEIVEADTGFTTPTESFLRGLILDYSMGITITPDSVLQDLEEYRSDFELTARVTRYFTAKYPDHVNFAAEAPATPAV